MEEDFLFSSLGKGERFLLDPVPAFLFLYSWVTELLLGNLSPKHPGLRAVLFVMVYHTANQRIPPRATADLTGCGALVGSVFL